MPTLETAARNAACNAVVDLIDAGSGAGTLVFETSGDVEVATLTFSDPAFGNCCNWYCYRKCYHFGHRCCWWY
jgi:hypothetical protein